MTASLLTLTQPNSPAAEAFRTLRSNLIFASLEQPLQTLLVTSAAADEGKSAALANLAVVMAQGGRRTILVDCDLRKPRQHTLFGAPNLTGFSDWMVEPDPAPPALTTIPGVPGLQLLPAGTATANPADLLTSPRIRELITTLKAQADFVLFDAAPLLAVSDAALLAAQLDGAVLVVTSGQSRRDDVQRAKELLEKIRVRVVGAVLTNAPAE
ncbi:MAG: CpsD/CapB family tyrosine-protein kinase [Anaerolineales bacterium]|nr:CpsD/CapB family tyrosine-protein kinase [Anaerolineales bacterium]